MFYQFISLNGLNISHFNIDNVTEAKDMFFGCQLNDTYSLNLKKNVANLRSKYDVDLERQKQFFNKQKGNNFCVCF